MSKVLTRNAGKIAALVLAIAALLMLWSLAKKVFWIGLIVLVAYGAFRLSRFAGKAGRR